MTCPFIQYDVVKDDFERPGFKQIHEHGGEKGEIGQDEQSSISSQMGDEGPVDTVQIPQLHAFKKRR
jgi:hypothetical protein